MVPGQETFRRAIIEFRNKHIIAGISPLILLRQELVANDEFANRGGTDNPTRDGFIPLLVNCDRWRRRVTHNPAGGDLGTKIEEAIDVDSRLTISESPFGGDDIQTQSGGLLHLPWRLDGSDPDLPMMSQLKFANTSGLMLLGAVDSAIVNWTRLESRNRTRFITRFDSMRIYGAYQEMLGLIMAFMGDENRVDVVQVLPSAEPLGPNDSPNRVGESSHTSTPE